MLCKIFKSAILNQITYIFNILEVQPYRQQVFNLDKDVT